VQTLHNLPSWIKHCCWQKSAELDVMQQLGAEADDELPLLELEEELGRHPHFLIPSANHGALHERGHLSLKLEQVKQPCCTDC
jgi:hypothetical protein